MEHYTIISNYGVKKHSHYPFDDESYKMKQP